VSKKLKQKPSKSRKTTSSKRIRLISLSGLKKVSRRPLIAGLAVALFMVPAGWLVMHAQTANLPASQLTGEISNIRGGSHSGGSISKSQVDKDRAASNKKNNAANKQAGAKADANKQAAGQKQATPSPAAKPRPAPVAPVPAPAPAPNIGGLHGNITTTIFWAGELADASNNFISNSESAWDQHWGDHFGGYDDPDHRSGYNPAAFAPKENPFYFALPYNDLDARGNRKATASSCPNVTPGAVSRCKNAWIKIVKGANVAYAQWEDVGPLQEDDYNYVFGTAAPANTWGAKAGLDVSPAVRDYLGLGDVDKTSWSFVSAGSVPAGPWKNVVTNSPGGW
jgi:hypothetical protein